MEEQSPSEDNAAPANSLVDRLRAECVRGTKGRPKGLDLSGENLAGADLSGLDLSGFNLSGADLTRANLARANLSMAKLPKAVLLGANLEQAEFLAADLSGANLNECIGIRAGFGGANLEGTTFVSAKLDHAQLSEGKLAGADLLAAELPGATLRRADLTNTNFTRAVLRGADLEESDVKGASFEIADLREARLYGIANYDKVTWVGADIRDMDLRGAHLVRRFIMDENYLHEFRTRSKLNEYIYWFWWFTSDCGRSLGRWAACVFAVAIVFAVLFAFTEVKYSMEQTFFTPLYYSIVTLTTLGYGDISPVSTTAQFLATLEAVLGYVGLGGLLSILANKMARRAE